MNLSEKEISTINKIDELAKEFGFKSKDIKNDDVIQLARWKKKGCEVVLYKQDEDDLKPWISFSNGFMSGNDPWMDWIDKLIWEEYFTNK
jgi:hypothetical protein